MIYREIKAIFNSEVTKTERKAIFLAAIGSMLEYFDFVIFGLMAIYISHDVLHGHLIHGLAVSIFFGVFFFGYLLRPFGMKQYTKFYQFAPINTLNTIVIMLLLFSFLIIAFMPTQSIFGSVILIFMARSLQGFARGAEAQSEFGYLFRHLGDKRSIAVYGLIAGAEIGVILALVVNDLLNMFYTPVQMNLYGWRIPFLISATFCCLIFIIRRMLRIKQGTLGNKRISMIPSYKLFNMFRQQVIFATLLTGLRACLAWLLILLIPIFLAQNLHINYRYIGHLMLLASLSSVVGSFLVLRFTSTKIARKILPFALVAVIPCLWLFAVSISFNNYIISSLILLGLVTGVIAVLVIRIIFGLFPSTSRLSSSTLCYNFGHTLVSGGVLLMIIFTTEILHRLCLNTYPISIIFLYVTVVYISILSVFTIWQSKQLKYFGDYIHRLAHHNQL